MTNHPPASEDSRLDRLEKKELALESELSRLDKEEKDLERRLTELELKEIDLAKSVSRLTQVKARRPEFLMNYMKGAKKRAIANEVAPAPMPSPAPAPAAQIPTPAPAAPAATQVQPPAPAAPAATQVQPPAPAAPAATQVQPPAPEIKPTPAPAQPAAPAQPKPAVVEKPPAPETKPAPAPTQPAPPAQPKPEVTPAAVPEAKPADGQTAASAQTLLPHIEEVKPKIDEKSERKQILEAQIKNVLKKQEMKKMEEQQKQEVLEAKTPIHKLNLDGKMSESAILFKLLLSKGAMTLEEAGKIMKADKDAMAKAAKDLEDSGLIEVNRPLYGSPKIRLKSLTEGMEKPQEKK